MTECRGTESDALRWLQSHGYSLVEPDGLGSQAFPDTFVPSAFHLRVRSGVENGADASKRLQAGSEWVYRHVDQGKVGTSHFHLSVFRMLVFFAVHPRVANDREFRLGTIHTFVSLLGSLGLDPSNCL